MDRLSDIFSTVQSPASSPQPRKPSSILPASEESCPGTTNDCGASCRNRYSQIAKFVPFAAAPVSNILRFVNKATALGRCAPWVQPVIERDRFVTMRANLIELRQLISPLSFTAHPIPTPALTPPTSSRWRPCDRPRGCPRGWGAPRSRRRRWPPSRCRGCPPARSSARRPRRPR